MKILWGVIFKDAEGGKCFTFRSNNLKRTQPFLRIKPVSEMTKTFLRDLLGQFHSIFLLDMVICVITSKYKYLSMNLHLQLLQLNMQYLTIDTSSDVL